MSNFCDRLKEERKRLHLNQEEFAALGGVKKGAQFNYENGSRVPDVDYLFAIGSAGVDLHYLLTGSPARDHMTADEAVLLAAYRSVDTMVKARVMGILEGSGAQMHSTGSHNISIAGDVAQQVIGDVHGKVVGPRTGKQSPKNK